MAAYGLSAFLLTASGRIGFPRFFILNPGSLRAEGSTPRSDPKDPLVPSDPFPPFVCEGGPLRSDDPPCGPPNRRRKGRRVLTTTGVNVWVW